MACPQLLHARAEACDRAFDCVRVLLPAFVQLGKYGLGIRAVRPAHFKRLQQIDRRAVRIIVHHARQYEQIRRVLRDRALIAERQPQHRAAFRQLHALHPYHYFAVVPTVGQTHLAIVLTARPAGPLAGHKMQHIFRAGFGCGQIGIFERGGLCRHFAQALQPSLVKHRKALLIRKRIPKLFERPHAARGVDQRFGAIRRNRIRPLIPQPLGSGEIIITCLPHIPDDQQARAVGQVRLDRNQIDRQAAAQQLVFHISVLLAQIMQHLLLLAACLCVILSVKRDRVRAHRIRRRTHFGVSRCDLLVRRVILHIGRKRQIIGQAIPLGKFFAWHRITRLPVLTELCFERRGRLHIQPHHCAAVGRVIRIARQRVLQAELHGAVAGFLGIALSDKAVRQRQRVAVGVVMVFGRGDGVIHIHHTLVRQPEGKCDGIVCAVCRVSQGHAAVHDRVHGSRQRFGHQVLDRIGVRHACHIARIGERAALGDTIVILQRAVPANNRVFDRHLTVRRGVEQQLDLVARAQQRQLARGGLHRLLHGCASRQRLVIHRGGKALGRLPGQPDRQPITIRFAHAHIDRWAVIDKGQPYDGVGLALGNNFALKPAFKRIQVLVALDMLDILAKVAEHGFDRIPHARQRVERRAVKAVRALGNGRPRQTRVVIKSKKITLCIIAYRYLGNAVDHPAAVGLRRGDQKRTAHILHTAAVHLEHGDILAAARRHERIAPVGRGRAAVLPAKTAARYLLRGAELLLLLRGQDGIDILPALVCHAARILPRKVGRGARVFAAVIGEVLRQPARVELSDHRDDHFAVVVKDKRGIHDIIAHGTVGGRAAHRAGSLQVQQVGRRVHRVAPFLLLFLGQHHVASRDRVGQAEVVFIQQPEFVERCHTVRRDRLGLCDLPAVRAHLKDQLFACAIRHDLVRQVVELHVVQHIGILAVELYRIAEAFRALRPRLGKRTARLLVRLAVTLPYRYRAAQRADHHGHRHDQCHAAPFDIFVK